jgi:hypothetical protein
MNNKRWIYLAVVVASMGLSMSCSLVTKAFQPSPDTSTPDEAAPPAAPTRDQVAAPVVQPTEAEKTIEEGELIFYEDFSSNDMGWETGQDSDAYSSESEEIRDGQYVASMTAKQDYAFAILSLPDFRADDFRWSTDMTVLDSTATADNLMIEFSFREADGVSGKHYSFMLYSDGTSSGEVWPDSSWQNSGYLWENVFDNAIDLSTGITNTVSVEADGPDFTFSINGIPLQTATDDTILEDGSMSIVLGLMKAGESLTIAFDNITVRNIP